MAIQESSKILFLVPQLGLVAFAAWLLLRRSRSDESNFRVREADRPRSVPAGAQAKLLPGASPEPDPLASARLKPEALRLTGIVLDGKPHEVLGISALATPAEIQKAYRDKMKRYHPDLVGRPGSREWTDAQKIAETINRAKEEMLRAAQARGQRS